ncbi:hypothetical protein A3K48_07970 [candidate division WOR-1 bacterium RIFOXYA12_FULL_52_29]|uniref:Peptidase S74 domain-containing protein n=1 Tax=candidate division WOR-1 bacterium RIFOXYC12_FULL_54_18 TaxID=1802584 RepID=A0A1F4T833_UNCSA|nr:MAG: hypothetical protein A3K44_07970 [candidate division WOR-1 bacterium RIFOXYA2_FULL_51_19]OGC18447.1 MAG: hypothetical protein A3K48_07970 [candidate division WOR-1 bacterium RIFOXYA12_FULL_52_29]OGC28864.1 MAG: hypothetical protein A3K49_07970 [candidate division WOR-1 bacterium RIFOXYC12_FULL_54_18]
MKKIIFVVFLGLLFIWGEAFAVPSKMNFQGKLTDSGGNPITSAVEVVFTIYDASSGGTVLWTETIAGLTPDQGLINQELGLATPITSGIFSGDTRYLAIKVGADAEMTPRIPLATVPFAFRAAVADSIIAGQVVTTIASTGATPLRDAVTLSGGTGISLIQSGQDIQITAVSTAGGTVTQVDTGSGLTGGPINTTGTVSIAAGGINATHLGTGVVTNDAIANNTITELKLLIMNHPVNSYLLTYTATGLAWSPAGGTGTVTQVDTGSGLTGGPINTTGTVSIAAGGINATHLGTGAVTAGAIAGSAVITAGISDGAVTAAKIGSGQVVTSIASSGAAQLKDDVTFSSGTGISLNQVGQNIQITAVSTAGGTVTQVNTQAPVLGGPITTTGTISMPAASGAADGYLTSGDWTTFNNKLDSADLSGYVLLGPTTQQSTTAAYAINVKSTHASGIGISAEVNTATGRAISGINSYSTGGMGGYFRSGQVSDGTLAIGVRGEIPGGTTYGELAHYINIVDSGTTKAGVYGYTSNSGSGVYGLGDSVGVLGSATSVTGTGVRGLADTGDDVSYGGYFRSGSDVGYGVYAYASGNSGTNYGLYARTQSPVDGYAVYASGGRNYFEGKTGIGTDNPQAILHVEGNMRVDSTQYGISVETDSRDGAAIIARNNSTSGVSDFGYAIVGKTSLNSTFGVLGYEDAGNPYYAGVYGQAVDADSFAIYGKSSASGSYAGYFLNQTNNGRAIYAKTESASGMSIAVQATAQNSTDYAVLASGGNGGTALYGSTTSTGYALKTDTGLVYLAGKTGVGTGNPFARLHVWGSTEAIALYTDGRVKMVNLAPAGAGTTLVITSTGEVVPQSSSRRYKKEIVDYQVDSAKFNSLRPVRFKWNDVSATPNQPDFGLIAEEVVEVYPELVALNNNGLPESVAYDKIGVILIKAVQEKNREIALLKNENEEIKLRLKMLEEKVLGVK